MKAVLCPVCSGTGKVDREISVTGKPIKETCHGCGGKGWVEVGDDKTDCVPWFPTYPTNPEPYYPWNPYPTYPTYPWIITCWS